MQKQSRPPGVSIIANFYIVAGILGIVGIALSSTGAFKASGVSAVSLAESLYILVTGYGLRKAKGWAWTISIIGIFIGFATGTYTILFNILPITGSISNQFGTAEAGVVTNIIITSIVTIFVIEIIILYHLYRPRVKAYFGKTTPRSASPTTLR
jgi:hypothetical protein